MLSGSLRVLVRREVAAEAGGEVEAAWALFGDYITGRLRLGYERAKKRRLVNSHSSLNSAS